MLAVFAPIERGRGRASATHALDVVIANKNAPRQCVLSGPDRRDRAQPQPPGGTRDHDPRRPRLGGLPQPVRRGRPRAVPPRRSTTVELAPSDDPRLRQRDRRALPRRPGAGPRPARRPARPARRVRRPGRGDVPDGSPDLPRSRPRRQAHRAGPLDPRGTRPRSPSPSTPRAGPPATSHDLACSLATLAALGYAVDLTRWDDGQICAEAPARKPGLTVRISGANASSEGPAATERPPAAEPAPVEPESSSHRPRSAPAHPRDSRHSDGHGPDDAGHHPATTSRRERSNDEPSRTDRIRIIIRTARPSLATLCIAPRPSRSRSGRPASDRSRGRRGPCRAACRSPSRPRRRTWPPSSDWPSRPPTCTASSSKARRRPSRPSSSCSSSSSDLVAWRCPIRPRRPLLHPVSGPASRGSPDDARGTSAGRAGTPVSHGRSGMSAPAPPDRRAPAHPRPH